MSDENEQKNEGYVGWADVGVREPKKNSNGERKVEYLKFEERKEPYRIRLIGKPIKFYSHFDVIRAISPGLDKDVCWQAGNAPKERYAILVLDRTDGNKLKVLEGGPGIFNEFKAYFELTGGKNDPGGANGPDWLVKIQIPVKTENGHSFKNKRGTKYQIVPDSPAPLTKEEREYFKTNWIDLPKVKAPTTPELIKEMFEDAKTCSGNDPIPGSVEWWKNRREKNGQASSSDETPMVPPEEHDSKPSTNSGENATSEKTFNGLFEEDDSSSESDGDDGSVKF